MGKCFEDEETGKSVLGFETFRLRQELKVLLFFSSVDDALPSVTFLAYNNMLGHCGVWLR